MAAVLVVKPAVPPKKDRAASKVVKVATSNLFITDQRVEQTDLMADAILEDIGGQELINITRNDLLNGQNVTYNVIENLESTQRKFNPGELIKLQSTSSDFFESFSLDLNDFTPNFGTGVIDAGVNAGQNSGEIVYVDPDTGNLIINTINLSDNLVLEVSFVSYSDISSTEV
jgi:hypothetical protein